MKKIWRLSLTEVTRCVTLIQSNATQVYLIQIVSLPVCYMFRPVLGPSSCISIKNLGKEDIIGF